ncbi:hypothetical protein V2J09_022178 [Rumex salicifolius]
MANPLRSPFMSSDAVQPPNLDALNRQLEEQDKTKPISSPFVPSPAARFPLPVLLNPSDQKPFPSTPTLVPSNGFQTVSPIPNLSTPPPPPMFSSPIRPAALPFRTSPSSPQPIAFSTNQSLPPSSPPSYTNGSLDHIFDVMDKSVSVGGTPQVLFSASKLLKQKKIANARSLGLGALVSPGRDLLPTLQIVERDPHRCQNCGAYPNSYCNILPGSGQWQCIICTNVNGSEGEYVASSKEELSIFPELTCSLVDYVQTGNVRPGFLPGSDARVSAPIVLVIDESLDEQNLQHLQSSLHAFADSLPPTTRLGVVSYGRTVSVYDFSEDSTASADVLPGDKSPNEEALKSLMYGTSVYLSSIHVSLPVAHNIFSSFREYRGHVPEAARDRSLGTAVEVALAIIKGPSDEIARGIVNRSGGNSRIIVCAAGPNTYGPGSVPPLLSHPNYAYLEKNAIKWMENLGKEAVRQHTVVDILCAGTCPVRVSVLQPLAKSSGGILIHQDDFGEAFGVNLQRAANRAAGSSGLLEIRTTDDIIITQVIGPGEEAQMDSHENFKDDTSLTVQMPSVEETQSFAIFMENSRDIKRDYVFFQFVIRYSNVYQADISRVITVRLPTVHSVSAYLESVQDDVAAVLIAKKTLLQAKTFSNAIEMRSSLDERVKDIAFKFGSESPKAKHICFPKELSLLPEMLFHLRRGPLLGYIIGHEDERSVLRNLFLNASFDLSLRMVAPRCLMHKEEGTFEELLAYDLAMQSDSAVVLDHGTDIFIWLGAELANQDVKCAAALAACRTLAEELSESRFPAPRILAFKEGSSPARYFVSRLIPAHKDPPYEQEARFPQLRSLSQVQRSKLKSSFIQFDDPSLCEWMRGLKLVPPEPS